MVVFGESRCPGSDDREQISGHGHCGDEVLTDDRLAGC